MRFAACLILDFSDFAARADFHMLSSDDVRFRVFEVNCVSFDQSSRKRAGFPFKKTGFPSDGDRCAADFFHAASVITQMDVYVPRV